MYLQSRISYVHTYIHDQNYALRGPRKQNNLGDATTWKPGFKKTK